MFSVALRYLAIFSRNSTPAGLSRPTKIFDLDDNLGSPPMHLPEDERRVQRLVRDVGASQCHLGCRKRRRGARERCRPQAARPISRIGASRKVSCAEHDPIDLWLLDPVDVSYQANRP